MSEKITTPIQYKKIIEGKSPKRDMDRNLKNTPYYGTKPFISVDPDTGERIEVSTAQQDIENRIRRAKITGQPVESITAPPPKIASDDERQLREKIY